MKRLLQIVLAISGITLGVFVIYVATLYANAQRGSFPPSRLANQASRGATAQRQEATLQKNDRTEVGRSDSRQILFGDLHVHTVYSADAHLQNLSIGAGDTARPPADACDFARFCSQLDFWSINDHAESLTPVLWNKTVEAIRNCNAVAGDPATPDLVSFLGWEWSHRANRPEDHYGHKNVVLLDTEEGRIPTRPIASASGPPSAFLVMGIVAPILGTSTLGELASFHRYSLDTILVEDCPHGVGVRELPVNCRESAANPTALFAKLADWGLPAIVIPHGLAWGITNPASADLVFQQSSHDPRWQRLLEVYSGHGNSEIYSDFRRTEAGSDGVWQCPPETADFEPCCQRAAKLAQGRCAAPDSTECRESIAAAQQAASNRFIGIGSLVDAVEGTTTADWGDCGQLRGTFLPAFNYRPRQSAQYAYALGGEDSAERFRWGLIGASDTHRSRPGTGYREHGRTIMTDGAGYPIPTHLLDQRSRSFYYTGGLAAVHAEGRDRRSIFNALRDRRVYATSGDRILLWFD